MEKPVVDCTRNNLLATMAVFVLSDGSYPDYAEPGSFEIVSNDLMIIACPGCGRVSGMKVGYPKPCGSPSWENTGGAVPTLRPSINCVGCCGWHGHLTDGVFHT